MNTTPSFSELKLETIQMLAALQDEAILDMVHTILMNAGIPADWYEQMSDEQKEEIRQSRVDLAAGNVVEHDDLMKRMQAWASENLN